MKEWMFKLIWVPGAIVITMCIMGVLSYLLYKTGWDVPFRWLCIITFTAIVADCAVNK